MDEEGKQQSEALYYLDDLTGLHNRRFFRERLLAEKREADEKGATFALMMIDLDNFKPINDIYGHLTGDHVLSRVSQLLKKNIPPGHTICRYAGDEFAAILPRTTEEDVIRVAERVNEALAQASWVDLKGEPIKPVTCSIGYAFYAEAGKDPTGLIGWADQALYAAKRRGGNGYCSEKDIPGEPMARPLVSTPYLVGREKEVGRLKSLLEEVRREGTKLLLVSGEIGVGKTRLLRESRQFVERRGGTALSGGCHMETMSIPYYPLREAFRRFFEERKGLERLPADILPEYSKKELARILPGLVEMHPTELERAPDSYRLFEAVRLLIQRISAKARGPLLFIIEDIHWSDKASLDLLQYLARNLKEASVLLCASYRTEETKEGTYLSPFLNSVYGENLAEEMRLKPLSSESVSAMLYLLYPGLKFSPEFHEFLYRKTEGSPFFVEELLKSLTLEEIQEGVDRVEEVPPSLRAVLESRINSLRPEMREVLACGALVGEEFAFEILCKVLDKPMSEIMDAVEEGTKAHMVTEVLESEGDRFRFVHSLMTDVLYSGISKVRRRIWHEQVGEAIENLYADRITQLSGQLMYHFERADNCEKALSYSLRAASQARDDYANEEAVRLYRKARLMLHRLDRDSQVEEMTIARGLGDICQLTGRYEEALREYSLLEHTANQMTDSLKEGEALCKKAQVQHLQGRYDEMMNSAIRARKAHEKAEDPKGIAVSTDLVGNAHFHRCEYEEALRCCEQALKIHRDTGNENGIAYSLQSMGMVHRSRGDYGKALDHFEQSQEIWKRIGDRRQTASGLNLVGEVYADQGDYVQAVNHHHEALKILRETGDIQAAASCMQNIGRVHSERGDLAGALDWYQRSLGTLKDIGNKPGVARCYNSIGSVYWNRGDYEKALEHWEGALVIRKEIGDVSGASKTLHNIGIIKANSGRYDEALERYNEALRIQREIGDRRGAARSLHSTGVVHWCRGDYDKALKSHEESLKIKRDIHDITAVGVSLLSIGSTHRDMGDFGKALRCFRESMDVFEEVGSKWGKTFVLQDLGALHQTLFDTAKAKEYLDSSLALLEEERMMAEKCEILTRIGLNHHLEGDCERALEEIEQALELSRQLGAEEAIPGALEGMAEVCLSRGDLKKASGYCDQLLKLAEERGLRKHLAAAKRIRGEIFMEEYASSESTDVRWEEPEKELREALETSKQIGALPLLWEIRASLVKLYEKKGDLAKARKELAEARRVIQQILSNIPEDALKETFTSSPQVSSILKPR